MSLSFLLIGEQPESQWPRILQQALSPLGKLAIVPEPEATQAAVQADYDVIIVDAGVVYDAALLTLRLRTKQPKARVIIVTASPTWRRARRALQSGAAHYIRKSFDTVELRSKIQEVLELPPPP